MRMMVRFMAKVANVFVNIPVKSIAKAYTYTIPTELSFIDVGWRVLVSFGSRTVEGFVVEVSEKQDVEQLKPIIEPVDQEPWFNAQMLALAYWLADYYLCSAAEAMRLFMPGKSGSKIKSVYVINENYNDVATLSKGLRIVYQHIKDQENIDLPALYKVFAKADLDVALSGLLKETAIVKDYLTKKNTNIKLEKYFHLTAPLTVDKLEAFKRKPAQKKLLEYLGNHPDSSLPKLKDSKFSAQTIQEISKTGFVTVTEKQILRDSYQNYGDGNEKNLKLTAAQEQVFRPINDAVKDSLNEIFLLHGITGSGKTQIYIETVKAVRLKHKKAIVLVPEIGLTAQMIRRFKSYFPSEVIVMHSRISLSERNDAITRIRNNEASIVIGARSAIFTPIDNLGAIIIDEEHDASYKQDESPRYHTKDVAVHLAKLHQAVLVLGSATPAIESFYAAKAGKYKLLTLPDRVGSAALPLIKIVDMRDELRLGRRNILSQALQNLIRETLAKGEQFIILLNRRGFSTFIMCRECGHVIACDQCTLPLTYHKNGSLQCHFCDTNAAVPDICPKCASRYIKYFGSGTEKLEDEMAKLFPKARVIRMDRDTTGGKFAHAEILKSFSEKRYDILLGTQMVAKGHDIENVTGVGIISADSSLNLPDFRAAERCFSLITQAAGRAGRGSIQGKVIVQTYNPEHYAVQSGAGQDYLSFYGQEIILRQQLSYPPYSDLIKLTLQHPEEKKSYHRAEEIIKLLKTEFRGGKTQVLGPAPSAIPKLREHYRHIILIKSQEMDQVKLFLKNTGLALHMDMMIDVNPLNVT